MGHGNDVLVGIDGSEASLHAAEWAASYARVHDLGLHLVCAYAVPSFTTAALDGGYAAMDDTAIAEGARAVLEEAKGRVARYGLPVTGAVATGDAAAVLVELSRSAAVAVVGTRAEAGSPSACSAPCPPPCPPTRRAPPSSCPTGPTPSRASRTATTARPTPSR